MSDRPRLHFIGVTTGDSRIMELFPVWSDELDLGAEMAGRDIEIGADANAYREAVSEIAEDPLARGALVTTHKVSVYQHAHDLFAEFDPYAELIGEVSCISKTDDEELVGHAKDPITAGQAMSHMIDPGHWDRHDEAAVLCMGSGGAGVAIVARLLSDRPSPAHVIATDKDPGRLDELRRVVAELDDVTAKVDYETVEEDHDDLLSDLPPDSLVINATGMGKDIPGSPLTDAVMFPEGAIVWELNYRGPRPFLEQARRQADARRLDVHDGWRYFLHGWTEVIAEVFKVDLDDATFQRLADAAEAFRP